MNEKIRGADLLAARQCMESQWDCIQIMLGDKLRNHLPGESLTLSLLSTDQDFASFAPYVQNSQTPEEMLAAFQQVLALDATLSGDYLQSIFSDSNRWHEFVIKNMLPVWVLVSQGNIYARAFSNCVSVLDYFNDGVEINYPLKPQITFEKGWTQLTLPADLVTVLRFNICQGENLAEVRNALFNLQDRTLRLPSLFRHTFNAKEGEVAATAFRHYLDMRVANHKPSAVTEGVLLKKAGFFKASDTDVSCARLAGTVGLPPLEMLEKFSRDSQQKKASKSR